MIAEDVVLITFAGGLCAAVVTRNESGTAVIDLVETNTETHTLDYSHPQRVPILFTSARDAMLWVAVNQLGW